MTGSKRRLAATPSQKRGSMQRITELQHEFIVHLEANDRAFETVRHYRNSFVLLNRCFAESDILPTSANLTSHHMNVLANWLRSTPTKVWRGKTERSVYGVHGCLKDIKIWLKWLVGEKYLEDMPKVPVPTLPDTLYPILRQDELDTIFQCSQVGGTSEISIRNRALLAFMLDTGVRVSEVARLQDCNLDISEHEAKITGKGRKERIVYFSSSCAESLRRWIAVRGESEDTTFWLKASGIEQLFKRIRKETGLALFTPHQVRHTALTMMVRNKADLHSVKRIAGHASVTTTEGYLALAGEDVKLVHRQASPFDQVAKRNQPSTIARRRLRTG